MSSGSEPVFLRNLAEWVNEQKKLLELFKKSEEDLKKADRLMLILAARVACHHISRTIRGFESWLQNPLVIGVMPEDMVREMWKQLWDIMLKLVEYDIKHTSDYYNYLKKALAENKLPPLLFQTRLERGRGREEYRIPYSL
ncbi:MAG: DUF2153 domain-containing protein [Thermoprotei archaeon]|nr:MAG: DUF2153 domain-containing protein [Thermoprotei archaeon]